VMLLNLAPNESHEFNAWKSVSTFGVPLVLILILIAEMVYILATGAKPIVADSAVAPLVATITPKAVAIRLYSSYSLGVELSSLLLLAAMVGAYHIGKKRK
jgi:NADH-quinone oxidoreductase subunit J